MQVTQRRIADAAIARTTAREMILNNKDREGQRLLSIMAYWYTAPFTNIPNATSSTYNIQTQGNTDFLILYLSGAVFNTATQANLPTPYCRVSISDNVTQLPMFNIPIFFSAVIGTAGFPMILQDPRLISATTIIQTTFYNDMTVGAVAADAQVSFGGYRAIYAG